jgi:HipA-like C-terminal domain
MPELYPILLLEVDSPEIIEQLGSKPKFWFRTEGDAQPWLFKFTRENTGEDWSEKVASEVAGLLGVPAATVKLAVFQGKRGSASRSFVLTKQGFDLIHGSELLAGRVLGYKREKRWRQSEHSIKNIIAAVENTFPSRQRIAQLRKLAGFIVLDAITCNTDRHHDNWALLRGPSESGKVVREIAPSFDHASSLGRELRGDRRRLMLAQGRVEKYALKGHGGIFWKDTDLRGENPLVLALKAAKEYPNYFRPWLEAVGELKAADLDVIVRRVPDNLMDPEAKQFCLRLMTVTIERLRAIQL